MFFFALLITKKFFTIEFSIENSMSEKSTHFNENNINVEIKCEFEANIQNIFLIFQIENDDSWYLVKMEAEINYFVVNIPNIKPFTKIKYFFKLIDKDNQEFIEDNNGNFYLEIAGFSTNSFNINQKKQDQLRFESENLSEENNTKKPSQIFKIEKESPKIFEDSTIIINSKNTDEEKIDLLEISKPVLEIQIDSMDINNKVSQIIDSDPNLISKEISNIINVKPLIPYNPFTPDDGEIKISRNALQSFTKFVDHKNDTEINNTFNSFIFRKTETSVFKHCLKCKANLQNPWKICPICGSEN